MFKNLLLILFFFSVCNGSFANCNSDSTITEFVSYSNDNPASYSYYQTVYHTDSGSYNQCIYNLTGGNWVSAGCTTGYYNDTLRSYDSNHKLVDIVVKRGTVNGWQNIPIQHFDYNSNEQPLFYYYLLYNGSSWDTSSVSSWIYNLQNVQTDYYVRKNSSGTISNYYRSFYGFNSGQKTSFTIQNGVNQSWINNELYTFDYSWNLRTGVNLFYWDTINNIWTGGIHAQYDSLNRYLATFILGDTTRGRIIFGDTITYSIDTLENTLFKSNFNGYTNPGYSESTFSIINNSVVITETGSAIIANFEGYPEIDWSCGGRTYFYYDSILHLIGSHDLFHCAMPQTTDNNYIYDTTGLLDSIIYEHETDFDDVYELETFHYSLSDSIKLIPSLSDSHFFCQGTIYQPAFVLAGGCGNYTIHWNPSIGLSSDTILNPQIAVDSTINYTIDVSDLAGHFSEFTYQINPITLTLSIDTSCNQGIWATLSAITNDPNPYLYYALYSDGGSSDNGSSVFIIRDSGNYVIQMADPNGCTLYTQVATITHPPNSNNYYQSDSTCSNQPFILPDGRSVNSPGNYTSYLFAASGCDSIINTELNILPIYSDTTSDTLLHAEMYRLPNGSYTNQGGIYPCTFQSANGCDSVIVVNLFAQPYQIIPSSFNANSYCYGSYYQPQFSVSGAVGNYHVQWRPDTDLSSDTILNPEIHVLDSIYYTISVYDQTGDTISYFYSFVPLVASIHADTSCNGNIWATLTALTNYQNAQYVWYNNSSILNGGQSYQVTDSGNYYVEIYDSNNSCYIISDIVSITHAPVIFSNTSDAAICEGDHFNLPDGNSADSTGIYTSIFISSTSCDSLIITNLAVNPEYTDTISDSIYAGQQFQLPTGQFVNQTGWYVCNLQTANGCDSIITIDLFVQITSALQNISGNSEIILSPVPVKNELRINTNLQTEGMIVHITDLSGQEVLSTILDPNENRIQMANLKSGTYIIVFYQKNYLIYRRIIEKM